MSKFNKKTESTKTTNLAGGTAYKENPEFELVSVLLTSFVQDQFYRSTDNTLEHLDELIKKCDKKFVAQTAIYARKVFGMRSISHVTAAKLSQYISCEPWAKFFYNSVIHRTDDMTEICSYYYNQCAKTSEKAKRGKKNIPNAMKKGFTLAFDRFDSYQLSKYRSENKNFKLVDLLNIIHVTPIEKNANALKSLINGELKSTETWEAKLSKTGQIATSNEEKDELKKEVWISLVKEKKIGYFALLRNLRNIIEQSPEIIDEAIKILLDIIIIKKSLVLPFRYITAYNEIIKMPPSNEIKKVIIALNNAIDLSLSNVPEFKGNTLVALDRSGSMLGNEAIIGSLFASVLIKSNNADLILFSDDAKYVNVNSLDSIITIANSINFASGGTNFHSIFQKINKKYDRIIILSDMQGWIDPLYTPIKDYNEYKDRTGANPFIYSIDLAGYGTLQLPENNVFCLAGFSDKIFDIIKLMEQDRNALIHEIKKIQL